VETGKTIAKTSKAAVRNGNCQWTESLSESTWTASQDESSKEHDDCLFNFVVAMVLINIVNLIIQLLASLMIVNKLQILCKLLAN
jgi:hypothetical protein